MRLHLRQSSRDNLDRWTSYIIDHGMKSSRSSSQLTDGGAAGGVVWLDEPFVFLSFLDLGSCTGGGTSCVGGHDLGGMKSSISSSQLTQVGAWGGAAWLDEPPIICSCGGQELSPEDLFHLLRLVCGITPPNLRHNSTEDTYQFTEIWYRFVNQLHVLGVILAYNYIIILLFRKYGLRMTDGIRTE